jgi:hypothetical protein
MQTLYVMLFETLDIMSFKCYKLSLVKLQEFFMLFMAKSIQKPVQKNNSHQADDSEISTLNIKRHLHTVDQNCDTAVPRKNQGHGFVHTLTVISYLYLSIVISLVGPKPSEAVA